MISTKKKYQFAMISTLVHGPVALSENQVVSGAVIRILEIFDSLLSKTSSAFSCIWQSLSVLVLSNNLLPNTFDKAEPVYTKGTLAACCQLIRVRTVMERSQKVMEFDI